MSILVSSLISELDINDQFEALTEAQQLAVFNSAVQQVADLYNDAGKDAFVRSTLEGASVPVANLKNPARAAFVDSAFTGLSAPFFTTEANALTYLQALIPVPSTTNPALLKSFLVPASQSALNLTTLLAAGIRVERISDNTPRMLTGAALPTWAAASHPVGTCFLVVPVSGPELLYVSDGAEWVAINPPTTVKGPLVFCQTYHFASGSPIAENDLGYVQSGISHMPFPDGITGEDISEVRMFGGTEENQFDSYMAAGVIDNGNIIGVMCWSTEDSTLKFKLTVDGTPTTPEVNISNTAAEKASITVMLFGPTQ